MPARYAARRAAVKRTEGRGVQGELAGMEEPIRAVRHVITLSVFDPTQLESFA